MIDERDPCMAFLLAKQLADSQVYLLVAVFSLRGKSPQLRVFHRDNLNHPSIRMPLEAAGHDMDKLLRKLVRDGYLRGGGPLGTFRATEAGNCVKHQFRKSRNDYETDGTPASASRAIEFVPELRRDVLRRCREKDPAMAGRVEVETLPSIDGDEE